LATHIILYVVKGEHRMETVTTQIKPALDKLQEERQGTVEKLEHLRADLRRMGEPSADETDVDAYEREKTLALAYSLERKLESLDRAIHLAQKGTYGFCESCGDRIDPARLEILPQATLCLKCQRKFERRNRR
jgi:DnaK suppressor protein